MSTAAARTIHARSARPSPMQVLVTEVSTLVKKTALTSTTTALALPRTVHQPGMVDTTW